MNYLNANHKGTADKKKITFTVVNQDNNPVDTQKEGTLFWPYAISKDGKKWAVTHLPSGYFVVQYRNSRSDCVRIVNELRTNIELWQSEVGNEDIKLLLEFAQLARRSFSIYPE